MLYYWFALHGCSLIAAYASRRAPSSVGIELRPICKCVSLLSTVAAGFSSSFLVALATCINSSLHCLQRVIDRSLPAPFLDVLLTSLLLLLRRAPFPSCQHITSKLVV